MKSKFDEFIMRMMQRITQQASIGNYMIKILGRRFKNMMTICFAHFVS